MALDNKIAGDKQYAFEINGIMKAIRTLFGNFLDKWGYIGKETRTSGDFTTPNNCNFVIIKCDNVGFGRTFSGEAFLVRNSKTVAVVAGSPYDTSNVSMSFSWSNNTITASGYANATAYYYS